MLIEGNAQQPGELGALYLLPNLLDVDGADAGSVNRSSFILRDKEGARCDDLFQTGQFCAGEHRGRTGGIIEDGRDPGEPPQTQQRHGCGHDVRQQHPDPLLCWQKELCEFISQQARAHQKPPVIDTLENILQNDVPGTQTGGCDDASGNWRGD